MHNIFQEYPMFNLANKKSLIMPDKDTFSKESPFCAVRIQMTELLLRVIMCADCRHSG